MVRTVCLITALVVYAASEPAWGQALAICDFVFPQSQFATLSLSGNYEQYNDRYRNDRLNRMNGSLALSGLAWQEGPEWSYSLSGAARLYLTSAAISWDYTLDSHGQLRRYLNENLFVFGGADARGVPSPQGPMEGLTVDALAGLGWGRYRDVTPLEKSFRISALLGQTLPAEQLQELAQLIGRQRELGLEGVMKEIEASLGIQLNVSTVLALQEILMMPPWRYCGWDVSASVGYSLISPTGEPNAVLKAETNWALPLDAATQITANARWRAPFPFAQLWTLDGAVRWQRLLTTTTDLAVTYRYRHVLEKRSRSKTHTLFAHLRVQLLGGVRVALQGEASTGTGYEEPEWRFDLSFTYDLF
jgi:hypothetical protein